jgi:hypothetical protein
MKNKSGIKVNDFITFSEEKLPYMVKAVKGKFAICTRKLDKKEDDNLLQYKVDMDAYCTKKQAFDDLKNEVVYTIIDFERMKRGRNDFIFNPYDYKDQEDIDKCMLNLLSGKCKLSKRNEIELTHFNIDRNISSKKIKTHVLWVSPRFPHDHPRKGEPTYFVEKILIGLHGEVKFKHQHDSKFIGLDPKLHTCRENYEGWKRKIDEVNRGEAILSLRMWSESPYNRLHDGSHPVEIARFDKDSGIGVQKLNLSDIMIHGALKNNDVALTDSNGNGGLSLSTIAHNDGLSLPDFKAWFRKADLSKPIAIIHFTKFRY